MVFGHYPLDGQLRCFQHLTASTSSEARKLCLYVFYPGCGSNREYWVLHWSFGVGPFAVPTTLYWGPHLCVCLSQPGSLSSFRGKPAGSSQTFLLHHSSPKLQSPSTGCRKGLCNPQNHGPGSSQQVLCVGPSQLPDLQILRLL